MMKHPVSLLQELMMGGNGHLPKYDDISHTTLGGAHLNEFVCRVTCGKTEVYGEPAKNKKVARANAATAMLKKLNIPVPDNAPKNSKILDISTTFDSSFDNSQRALDSSLPLDNSSGSMNSELSSSNTDYNYIGALQVFIILFNELFLLFCIFFERQRIRIM